MENFDYNKGTRIVMILSIICFSIIFLYCMFTHNIMGASGYLVAVMYIILCYRLFGKFNRLYDAFEAMDRLNDKLRDLIEEMEKQNKKQDSDLLYEEPLEHQKDE